MTLKYNINTAFLFLIYLFLRFENKIEEFFNVSFDPQTSHVQKYLLRSLE